MDDIRPLFFATQLPSQLRRPHTQHLRAKPNKLNEQQRSLSPYERLKRMKQQMQKTKHEYFKTLSQNHRLQLSLSRIERKKHQTRNDFLRVYGNLKYKKFLEQTRSQSQSRSRTIKEQRTQRTKKKKLEQELQRILTKNEQQERIAQLQQRNKLERERMIETKHQRRSDTLHWSKSKHDTVKTQHTQFVIRKANISSILQERSKLNYMKKVNKELCLLKEYESVIEDIGSFNIEEIRRLAVDEEKLKGYETFFMTTKNTINSVGA